MIRILSLYTGGPRELVSPDGKPFTSSIARERRDGPATLGPEGFEGDACGYPGHHGEWMMVNAVCEADYRAVEGHAGRDLPRPSFGENLHLDGYSDAEARVGDVLRAPSGAALRVTQPREPCGTIVRYLGEPRILKWLRETHRSGFYLRVEQAGTMAPGETLELAARGPEEWTIARLNGIMDELDPDDGLLAAIDGVDALSPRWKQSFRNQVEKRRARS